MPNWGPESFSAGRGPNNGSFEIASSAAVLRAKAPHVLSISGDGPQTCPRLCWPRTEAFQNLRPRPAMNSGNIPGRS
eukprot:8637575-Pyramimonas_sp.AAC.1